jgi:ribonucleoside-diphosphate reductase beta chain
MSLLDAQADLQSRSNYPWAYDAWLMQQRPPWLPEEVPLADDVKDWRNKLTEQRAPSADADLPLLSPRPTVEW